MNEWSWNDFEGVSWIQCIIKSSSPKNHPFPSFYHNQLPLHLFVYVKEREREREPEKCWLGLEQKQDDQQWAMHQWLLEKQEPQQRAPAKQPFLISASAVRTTPQTHHRLRRRRWRRMKLTCMCDEISYNENEVSKRGERETKWRDPKMGTDFECLEIMS